MRRMLMRLGASVAETRFKRAPQGWIFRAPTPWIFGPRRHYLVSDAQKAKIEMVLGLSLLVTCLLLAVSVLILVPPSVVVKSVPNFEERLLIFVVYCLAVSGLQDLGHCFAFRAILKNSLRTSEKITLAERLKSPAAWYSIEQLKFLLILFVGLFLGSLFLFAYQLPTANVWGVFLSIAGIVASGWALILFGALLRVKLRSSRRI